MSKEGKPVGALRVLRSICKLTLWSCQLPEHQFVPSALASSWDGDTKTLVKRVAGS